MHIPQSAVIQVYLLLAVLLGKVIRILRPSFILFPAKPIKSVTLVFQLEKQNCFTTHAKGQEFELSVLLNAVCMTY